MKEPNERREISAIVPGIVLLGCVLAILITNLTIAANSKSDTRAGSDTRGGSDIRTYDALEEKSPVKEIQGYRQWSKVNSVPQLLRRRSALDCWMRITTTPVSIDVDGDTSPHVNNYITVYVNDVGKGTVSAQGNRTFPVGSVIVKEKLPDQLSKSPELLTVMIKQKKGFNPATGDWEYMVVDGTGTEMRARGNLQHCHSCHVAETKRDYIFQTKFR